MARYRKKPVVIDAVEFDGSPESADEIADMATGDNQVSVVGLEYVSVKTLEGVMTGNIGDYIIKGVSGELYPCKPDIFHKTYERVE